MGEPTAPWLRAASVLFLLLQAFYFRLIDLAIGRISGGTTALVVSLQPILVGLLAAAWPGLALAALGVAVATRPRRVTSS